MARPHCWNGFWVVLISVLALGVDHPTVWDFQLYVGNSRGDDISIIDMTSLKVTGEIKAGERVHGVGVQADGRRLFATVETDHTLRVIDSASRQTIATIKVTGRPNQCAVTPDGKYVAVPIRDGDSVDICGCRAAKDCQDSTHQGATQRPEYRQQPRHGRR